MRSQKARRAKPAEAETTPPLPERLPEFLRPLFWEVEFRKVSPRKHQSYICMRIMEHGDLQAIRWMLQTYGKETLREWLIQREGRGLSPRTLRFWEVILNIPHRQVTRWLRSRPIDLWEQRTHRASTKKR
ncbi:hypothetical protein GXSOP10_14218 [Armatimonadetes bacterium GXS]|nr:hypothetical protein GXSOP10_14218 [Armatimonadetes bacterium GXS]